jgi:hypothetical protein
VAAHGPAWRRALAWRGVAAHGPAWRRTDRRGGALWRGAAWRPMDPTGRGGRMEHTAARAGAVSQPVNFGATRCERGCTNALERAIGAQLGLLMRVLIETLCAP